MAKVTTVIDIGSNSARMAIFRKTSRFGFYLLCEIKSKVRISEGSYQFGGVLQEKAMQRALSALIEFKSISAKYGSKKLFCVATSAIRDAPNAKDFLRRVKEACGIDIKVIDGKKEAFYGGIACANLSHKKDGITIDIGGGSTECAFIKEGKILDLISLNIGTIRLKELFFDKNQDLNIAKEFIKKELEKLPQSYKHSNVFGVGGTIRAISKMIMRNTKYPIDVLHGYEVDVRKHLPFIEKIYTIKEDKLSTIGVTEDRKDNIQSGALILAMLLKKFEAQNITTSGVGVREGVFLSDLLRNQKYSFPNNLNPSLIALKDRFLPHPKHGENVRNECLKIFDALKPLHKIDEKYKFHLSCAGMFSSIGRILSFYDGHEHSAYFLLHALDYGFSHQDKAIICLLAQFSNKKIPKDISIAHISDIMPPILTLQWLSFVLGMAEAMSVIIPSMDTSYSYEKGVLKVKSDKQLYLSAEIVQKLVKPANFDIEFYNKGT
ncbi:Ppx/GppA phosphatase family protein [Helicobacter cappadocius]|uniref:Ppx/GppA phosphatase family protein n=1 Tax=Helicobacter cappadocius TaxID=3063998 RepID=A0AA90PI04_9HELI|nr:MULTISPECIES: Ppx/GppA phosphatase family protein [unclassified Helicobacter]MDO7252304.1 Ppx/GppA phosphatase family protein [Helicobacter sp. faydin-H75]MDP2538171.1 Ppx/GppA phosphatase family protein [Helicobacter sp. faydin-H76]